MKDNWLQTNHNIPQRDDVVLGSDPDGALFLAYHCDGQWFDMTDDSVCEVDYWMPLPAPPVVGLLKAS